MQNTGLRSAWALLAVAAALALAGCSGGADAPKVEEAPVPAPVPEPQQPPPMQPVLSPAEQGLPPELTDLVEPRFADLDGMVERRYIRFLTVYQLGGYFLDGVQERGLTYEAVQAFEEQLNKKLGTRHLKVHVLIIPVHRDELIPALVQGYGDIAGANLTITPDRLEHVEFSNPFIDDVSEIVVTGSAAPPLETVEDLGGLKVHVRRSSSYWESLERLNERLQSEGKPLVDLVPAPETLQDNDLIEMVQGGLLPLAIVDSHKARFWDRVFENIEVREDLALNTGGEIAWAFRKDSPQLAEVINEFVRTHKRGTLFGNVLLNRYLKQTRWVHNALAGDDFGRFRGTIDLFKRYAGEYDFDYLMVAAQGYQESRLDQSARSSAGAIGVMQLLPSTAAGPQVGIPNVEELEANVHAGVKYLHFLRTHYFSDEGISEDDRVHFSLAAYNAGPTRLQRMRRKAAKLGLDPNVWFRNVEVVAAKEIGRETVQYVSNIMKYHMAYKMIIAREEEHVRSREKALSD
ncbi:MAG: lytic transglycosylase F [Acidobacteria bacterium]|nr:MAG: lytic transglycosylase F [Acidobacteriota bacterium]